MAAVRTAEAMRIEWRSLWLLALSSGLLACSSGGSPLSPVLPAAPSAAQAVAEEPPQQSLFRVRYQGPAGSGTLKLTLRLAGEDRFQLSAADMLGRPLWSLEQRPDGVLLLDHRQRLFCDLPVQVRLPELALAPLPVRSLPRVLMGRLPVPPAAGSTDLPSPADGLEFEDAEGRRWSAVIEDGRASSWTLWSEEAPLLWWMRQEGGGILSHREGAQFRWRRVVAEPLTGDLRDLEAPPEYLPGACDDS